MQKLYGKKYLLAITTIYFYYFFSKSSLFIALDVGISIPNERSSRSRRCITITKFFVESFVQKEKSYALHCIIRKGIVLYSRVMAIY
jgi:hypothetical protein